MSEIDNSAQISLVDLKPASKGKCVQSVDKRQLRPEECLEDDEEINLAMKVLPSNYNFEIKKSIHKIRSGNFKRVALQFPEGLLLYSCMISDILTQFTKCECFIMGDVTYGACCIDDFGAASLGCDFLIHYGHSCLVPIDVTVSSVKMLYVFVDITFDATHLISVIKANFAKNHRIGILGTIQFASTLHYLRSELMNYFDNPPFIPQARPLSPGEVLGCTSPQLSQYNLDSYVFVADGRFHLESVMIHNPTLPAFRYDPYSKVMTSESYDTASMLEARKAAILKASSVNEFGLILGTLGRQGNSAILNRLQARLDAAGKRHFLLLLSEVTPAKLNKFKGVGAWIQIACPRLSIDWGEGFNVPVLTPYEAEVCLGGTEWRDVYPMDFYARGSGPWTNYYSEVNKERKSGSGRVRRQNL